MHIGPPSGAADIDKQTDALRVFVFVAAYNQAAFIEKTLNSILAQKTDFPVLVHVQDDASTDGTRQIIERYVADYPDRVQAVLFDVNQFQLGHRTVELGWPHFRGRYVAFLDGDDEWIDPDKLQTQVDYMEAHPECAICQTLSVYFDEKTQSPLQIFPKPSRRRPRQYLEDLARGNFIQTSAALFRHSTLTTLPEDFKTLSFCDYGMFALMARQGWIGLIPQQMTLYRIHNSNMWYNAASDDRKAKENAVRDFVIRHIPEAEQTPWHHARDRVPLPLGYRVARLWRRLRRRYYF